MSRRVTSFIVCSVALASASCTTPRVPPEQAVAKLRQKQEQEKAFVSGLAAAVREQPRNEAWASAREQQLRQSYSEHPSVPKDALKRVECRQSRCELQLAVAPTPEGPRQAIAIDQWIAWSQPCGYTLTQEPGTEQAPGTVQVFLECEASAQ